MTSVFRRSYLPRPPMSPLIRTPVLKTSHVTNEQNLRVVRRRSVEPLNKGILSEKVPISFNQEGIVVHPLPTFALAQEDKVSLYSEIERLTMINYELKGQNEALLINLQEARTFATKVPNLEAIIHDLDIELIHKTECLNQTVHNQELLKIDNLNLIKLEPAYSELLEHNKALIAEIDNLDIKLRELILQRDVLEASCDTVKVLEPRLTDATRRIDIMSAEILERDQQIAHFATRIQELNIRLNSLILENQEVRDHSDNQFREQELMRAEIEILHRAQEKKYIDLKIQMEDDSNFEKTQIIEKFSLHLMKNQEELLQAKKMIEGLQDQIEHLRKRNIEKSGEVDTLSLRIHQLEDDRLQSKRQSEVETFILIDRRLTEQKSQHDAVVIDLQREICELERFKILFRNKETEVESLKAQFNNNEKVWEFKMQHAITSEAKSASTKHGLERSLLESEMSMNKDQLLALENQNQYLSEEVDRLNSLQGMRFLEINELQKKLTTQEINARLTLEDQRTQSEIERRNEVEDTRRELERVHQDRVDEMRRFQISLEEKVLSLMDENRRLSDLTEDRAKEADSAHLRLKMVEDIHRNQLHEAERRSEIIQKVNIEKEVNSASLKHRGERSEFESKINQLSFDVDRVKSQSQGLESELERIRQVLQGKELELQQEKRRLVELEIQRNRDINEVREQFDNYKRANVDINTLQIRFEAEKSSLSSQLTQYKDKTNELEKRLLLFIGENEKMRNLYNEKANELELSRLKIRDFEEKSYNEKAELEHEIDYLKRASLDSKETSIRFSSEKSQFENQIKQLKIINENGKQELEKLYELMNQRKKDQDYYIKQNDDLKKEVERLARQARDVDNESSTKKDRVEGMERTIREIERDRDLYKSQVERLNTQLEVTHSELLEKIKELDGSKTKYDESIKKLSTQLDKDLMTKLLGSSVVNMSPERRTHSSGGGYGFDF